LFSAAGQSGRGESRAVLSAAGDAGAGRPSRPGVTGAQPALPRARVLAARTAPGRRGGRGAAAAEQRDSAVKSASTGHGERGWQRYWSSGAAKRAGEPGFRLPLSNQWE